MILDIEFLDLFTILATGAFIVLVFLAFVRMFYRLYLYLSNGVPPPRLLKRDLALFSSFVLSVGGSLILDGGLGITLNQQAWWIIPPTLLTLVAMAYWVWVEFRL